MAKIYLPTSQQADETNRQLALIAKALGAQIDTATWAGVQKAVRAGIAPEQFPIGTQLVVNHSKYGERLYDVVAHNYLKSVRDPDAPTMTLMQHDLIEGTQFDRPEALYYAETELASGTYNFTFGTYDKWVGGTYQFTLAQAVPAGGQICITGQYPYQGNITAAKVSTYTSKTSTSAIESNIEITEGSNGTALGTCGEVATLNHIQRVAYGSNNYKESAVRQFLNSSAAAGSVWTPQTKFDRPPDWNTNRDGFMKGLDADFLAVVGAVTLPCSANSIYESPDSTITKGTAYTLNDKFYLASRAEVFNSHDVNDGSVLFPYYEGAVNADRIKYRESSAATWWLRTPSSGGAVYVRLVYSDGTLSTYGASNAYGLAPACTIV